MKTYVKHYGNLNNSEKESFLNLSEFDPCMSKILENIEKDRSLDVDVAFTRQEDNSIVAVDYSVNDPYNNYIPTGYNNWGFGNYNEDEEVASEEDLPLYWDGMTYEEKVHELKQIDKTFHFASDHADASSAAAAVSTGYVADPDWFGFVVDDLDKWEEDMAELLEPYFVKKSKISCDLDFYELLIQGEGGWDGWYRPVWAKVVEDEDGDYIELTLGGQVSKNTSFFDDDAHSIPKSWVGGIQVWHRWWDEDDAEAWAQECCCNPEDFDCDENMKNQASMMIDEGRFDEDIEDMKKNIIEYAKSEGYEEVEFD